MLLRSVATFLFSFLSFWETQQGHVRSQDQSSHLQLRPLPPTHPRTCDTPEGAKCVEKEPRTSPPEEGVSRLMRGEQR